MKVGAQSLWLALTVMIPGMVFFGVVMILMAAFELSNPVSETIKGSELLGTCVLFAVMFTLQLVGIGTESLFFRFGPYRHRGYLFNWQAVKDGQLQELRSWLAQRWGRRFAARFKVIEGTGPAELTLRDGGREIRLRLDQDHGRVIGEAPDREEVNLLARQRHNGDWEAFDPSIRLQEAFDGRYQAIATMNPEKDYHLERILAQFFMSHNIGVGMVLIYWWASLCVIGMEGQWQPKPVAIWILLLVVTLLALYVPFNRFHQSSKVLLAHQEGLQSGAGPDKKGIKSTMTPLSSPAFPEE